MVVVGCCLDLRLLRFGYSCLFVAGFALGVWLVWDGWFVWGLAVYGGFDLLD